MSGVMENSQPGERAMSKKESTLDLMPTFITVDELARLLRVNRNTAYDAIERGEVPGVVRIGRKIRVCRDTVVQWMRGNGGGSRF